MKRVFVQIIIVHIFNITHTSLFLGRTVDGAPFWTAILLLTVSKLLVGD